MKKFALQSFLLLLSFGFIFIWQNTPLSNYSIQILAFFILVYILISAKNKSLPQIKGVDGLWNILILNTSIVLFIFATGVFSSPLFFLLYFLAFGIAFVFEPSVIFVFIIGTFLVFLQDAIKGDAVGNFLKLGSLCLLSPLTFFFGKEYKDQDKKEEKLKKTKDRTENITEEIDDD